MLFYAIIPNMDKDEEIRRLKVMLAVANESLQIKERENSNLRKENEEYQARQDNLDSMQKDLERSQEDLEVKQKALETKQKDFEAKQQKYEDDCKEYKEKQKEYEERIQALEEFIMSLRENYGIEKISKYVQSCETLSSAAIRSILRELNKTKVPKGQPVDIGEAGNVTDAALDVAENKTETVDYTPEGWEKHQSELNGKKKRGRQDGVKTCGRNLDEQMKLEQVHLVLDAETDDSIPAERKKGMRLLNVRESHKLIFVKAHLKDLVVTTYVYVAADGTILQSKSPLPPDILDGGKVTNGVIASICADKVLWALPLHKQATRMNILCGHKAVSSQLLNYAFLKAGEAVQPVAECICDYIKNQKAIHGDESRLFVLNNSDKNKAALGQVWSLSYHGKGHDAAYYRYYPSRRKECAEDLYSGCSNIAVQTDGYSSYGSVIKAINEYQAKVIEHEDGPEARDEFLAECDKSLTSGVLLVGCLAHARRRFAKALLLYGAEGSNCRNPFYADVCTEILEMIQEIYAAEKQERKKYDANLYTEEQFLEERKKRIVPILKRLRGKIEKYSNDKKIAPAAKLEEALSYLLKQYEVISNFLECSELSPDNNFQEQQFRPLAGTRRTCMFATSEKGAKAWVTLLSLLQTAVLNQVDPTAYLKYLLDEIAGFYKNNIKMKDVDWNAYLPWNVSNDTLAHVWNLDCCK